MIQLSLIGIGTGNPHHLTQQAQQALRDQDLILIPTKGADKDDLVQLRHAICTAALQEQADAPKIQEFALPERDPATPDYRQRVSDWHDQIALCWKDAIKTALPHGARNGETVRARVGFLVWGDPSLYDSTLRIAARLGKMLPLSVKVVPGITAIQALTAAHAMPLNQLAEPVLITTGRQLRDHGWPEGQSRVVVMLDGQCSFQTLPQDVQAGLEIYWTAYAGMEQEINLSGPLPQVTEKILTTRAEARSTHGWLMDIYLLSRSGLSLPVEPQT